jgi:hypothetical protein
MAAAGEYKRGSMDITAQKQTYRGVIKGAAWGTGLVIVILVLLALITL